MKIRAVLFDLDGSLLPMDQDVFIKAYLGGLCKTLAPKGYTPDDIGAALWKSTAAMVTNNGEKTNEEVFWDNFCALLGQEIRREEETLRCFYEGDFQRVREVCGYDPRAKEIVYLLKERGVKVVLATNPLFPAVATESRIRWAGLEPSDFLFYTTYENSSFCKPNLKYYSTILDKLGLTGEDCIMVGNDVGEDMIAEKLGMKVFLLTDCLINKAGKDISKYPSGSLDDLFNFLSEVTE